MCIISCILGRLSWSDGSWPVDFSLDVDLECNLERILKGLLHWQWIGTPPVPSLEEFREGSSKLAEEC